MFVSGPLSSVDYELHGAVGRKRPYGAQRVGAKEVHILVIGESSRRDSWSVYGYARPTTPYLQSIAGEVVFLRNAVADANATMYSVPILLTGSHPEAFQPWATTGNIVDLTKESGYFTAWLVNQDPSPSSIVGMDPDVSKYTYMPKRMTYFAAYSPDQVLLSELEGQLARKDVPLFVGLHVYGSHAPYAKRYPSSFAHFSTPGAERDSLDSYDDTILYTDWFLGQVIERVRRLDVPATVTYLSDHGEELQQLDGRSGHGASDYSPHAFEIPAFVWSNLAYRHQHPEKIAALVANASKEVRTHDFFYSVADLMGIRWPGLSSRKSFVSVDFVPDVSEKHIAGGKLVSASR
jgi:glucan phosphoethanolaminetransferase (alkaline phosphatase superfamily)